MSLSLYYGEEELKAKKKHIPRFTVSWLKIAGCFTWAIARCNSIPVTGPYCCIVNKGAMDSGEMEMALCSPAVLRDPTSFMVGSNRTHSIRTPYLRRIYRVLS